MLKTVFIGTRNEFDEILIHWLARRTQVVGVVWTSSSLWGKTWAGRLRMLRRRARRYGLPKVIDETLYYLYQKRYLLGPAYREFDERIIQPYFAEHGRRVWGGDSIETDDVNEPRVRAFLEERAPDLALAMCVNDYFGKKLLSVPRLGVYLWHEGYTPEYRGLYSPFWAVHNLDFDRIGYSVLRMNAELDGGEVYVQGPACEIDPFRQHSSYLGHKAIMDSLPAVERLLGELEAGTARPIDRSDAVPGYYTYPGLSNYLRQRYRLRRLATIHGRGGA